jgi:hypothetical protein
MRAYPTRVSLHSDAIAAPTPECDYCSQIRSGRHTMAETSFHFQR